MNLTEEQRVHIEAMRLGLQRYRSNVAMEAPGISEEFLAGQWPWVFGDNCPLSALAKMAAGEIRPMDYYNMRVIFASFMPEVLPAVNMILAGRGLVGLPYSVPSIQDLFPRQTALVEVV